MGPKYILGNGYTELPCSFLGAFVKNGEKRLLASSCLSVRMEQLGAHWTDFHEI